MRGILLGRVVLLDYYLDSIRIVDSVEGAHILNRVDKVKNATGMRLGRLNRALERALVGLRELRAEVAALESRTSLRADELEKRIRFLEEQRSEPRPAPSQGLAAGLVIVLALGLVLARLGRG